MLQQSNVYPAKVASTIKPAGPAYPPQQMMVQNPLKLAHEQQMKTVHHPPPSQARRKRANHDRTANAKENTNH